MTQLENQILCAKVLSVLILLSVFLGIGCAKTIQYDLDLVRPVSSDVKRQSMRVAVAPLQDVRAEPEKHPSFRYSKKETGDKMFKDGDVAKGVSQAIVKHFNYVQLFQATELVDNSYKIPSADIISRLNAMGYDLLLSGKLSHFYGVGYKTAFDKYAGPFEIIPQLTGFVGTIRLLQKNDHLGYIELSDLQLTDTLSGSIVWSGSFSEKSRDRYRTLNPADIASETLKKLVTKIIIQIESMPGDAFLNQTVQDTTEQ